MRFHREASRDRYDVAVVGSGLGGLTAAALLARAGRSVLVVERHDRAGGYAHAFRRGRYRFDSAVHLVSGMDPRAAGGGLVGRVLEVLDPEPTLDWAPVDPVYAVQFPEGSLHAATGLERFLAQTVERFPHEEKGLRAFAALCVELRAEIEAATRGGKLPATGSFPALRRFRRANLRDVLEAHVDDPLLRAGLAGLWPYLGLPPSRVSFLYFATMWLSYVADGAGYCRGTFQRFADRLAGETRRAGGEVLLRSTVRRITVADGRVSGLTLENGQHVEAPLVVSNADLGQTAFELVGREHFPARSLARWERLEPSVSAFVVYAAAASGPAVDGRPHETFFYRGLDHEDAFERVVSGDPSWLSVTLPSALDPTLAPEGERIVLLTTLMGYAPATRWRHDKEALTDRLLEEADRQLPGLHASLRFQEGGSPRTMERYTRNRDGALYGFALSPAQVGAARPGQRTPLPGLYLAGHWTQPGGGVYGVVQSGAQAAAEILGLDSTEALLERTRG